jgi:hypothetical protein
LLPLPQRNTSTLAFDPTSIHNKVSLTNIAAKCVDASQLAIVLLGAAFINVCTRPISSSCITTKTEAGETAGSVGTILWTATIETLINIYKEGEQEVT